jgi:hypothetical protein
VRSDLAACLSYGYKVKVATHDRSSEIDDRPKPIRFRNQPYYSHAQWSLMGKVSLILCVSYIQPRR